MGRPAPERAGGSESPDGEFDALLREGGDDPAEGRGGGRPSVLLLVCIGAVLLGFGVICAAAFALTASRFAVALDTPDPGLSRPETASAAQSEPLADAAQFDADGGGGVDPAWLNGVATRTGIPERALVAYASAAARLAQEQPGCGLGWNTLAGIGWVESEHGRYQGSRIRSDGVVVPAIVGVALDGTSTARIPDTDTGVLDGDTVWDRAVGPMQFIPSTWAVWGSDGNGDGAADPQHIDDAAYSAARYLCAGEADLREPSHWIAAVAAYNDTVEYNHRVAEAATRYARLASAE